MMTVTKSCHKVRLGSANFSAPEVALARLDEGARGARLHGDAPRRHARLPASAIGGGLMEIDAAFVVGQVVFFVAVIRDHGPRREQ